MSEVNWMSIALDIRAQANVMLDEANFYTGAKLEKKMRLNCEAIARLCYEGLKQGPMHTNLDQAVERGHA